MYSEFLKTYLDKLNNQINNALQASTDEELKSFYNSTTGRFFLNIIGETKAIFKYSAEQLVDQLSISTVTDRKIAINLAKELGYHIQRPVPAYISYNINIKDPQDPIWENINSIILDQDFELNNTDVPLKQGKPYEFFLNSANIDNNNVLYQVSKYETEFEIKKKQNFIKISLPNSKAISNNFNTDIFAPSLYSFNLDENINIIKSTVSEENINNKIIFAETNENDNLDLLFGSDTFGHIGFGKYKFTAYQSLGALANLKIQSGKIINIISPIGISLVTNSGEIIKNPDFIINKINITTSSDLTFGENADNIDDIKSKAIKSFQIRNTLVRDKDYLFILADNFNINNVNVWGDNKENIIRNMNFKNTTNTVFISSPSLKYDFKQLNTNIKFNFANNKSMIEDNFNYDNNKTTFDVVPICKQYSDNRINNCISFKTLYMLGYIHPIILYYNKAISNNHNSKILSILNTINNMSDLKNIHVYIEPEIINIDIKVSFSGNTNKTDLELKYEIIDNFNKSKSINNSVISTLNNYNLNLINIDIINNTNNSFFNNSLQQFLKSKNIDPNTIQFLNNIIEFKNIHNNQFINPINNYNLSALLQDTRTAFDIINPILGNKIIKEMLQLLYQKINYLKIYNTNNNNFNNLNSPIFFQQLNNIYFNEIKD